MRFAARLVICTALCLLVAGGSLASAAERNPIRQGAVDQGKAEAATLLNQGKAMEAYRLYSRLLRESPEDDEVNLGLARSAMAAGRQHQAIMAYERLLEEYPNEPALLKELAHALTVIGDKEKARLVLERGSTLGEADVDDFMQVLGRRYDRFQFHGRLSAGLVYDSNANQGPASNVMNLGNYRGVIVDNASEVETAGAFVAGLFDFGYRLGQASSWWLVSDLNFYARGNENNELAHSNGRYLQWYRLSAGLRHLTADTLLDLRLKSEVFDYEFNQSVYAAGPEGLFAYAPVSWLQLVTRAGVDRRDYVRDRSKNGTYGHAGQYLRFFVGDDQHEIMTGVRYLGGQAERSDYSYDGWEASASLNLKLPWSLELLPSISYAKEYYNGPATALETEKRKDERIRAGMGVVYRIDKDWTLETFYQYTKNNSKSELYEYDRHLVTTGIAWNF